MKIRSIIIFFTVLIGGSLTSIAQESAEHLNKGGGDRIYGEPWATRSAVLGTHAMVATSHPLASQIAIDILKSGGNAVDAAIAANATLGLMEPTGNGIGGDLFAIIWDPKTEKLHGLNASGRSSMSQTLDQLKAKLGPDRRTIPGRGVYSVSIPGAVDGWDMLRKRFGSMDMAELMAPAVGYAREGFPMTQVIGSDMANNMVSYGRSFANGSIEEFDNFSNLYFKGGKALAEGEIFKNPDLANTLETIGREGRDAFYKGSIARTMAAYMERNGGPLTYDDFAAHSGNWIEPVSVNYRGLDVWELPPNGQGIAALQILNIMEGYDVASMDRAGADYWHLFVEASKVAYADRARFYADPDFYKVSVETLLSKEYAADRAKLIDMNKAATKVDHGDPKLMEGDTIYLTIADEDGMMVSLIQSNYSQMGSGLVPDGLGFAFQNRGALFSLDANHPNAYEPNKRPFHTIIPAFVTKDGKPWMSFGLMGGAIQPQGHAQIIVDMVDFGMTVQEAGDAARFFHTGSTEPTSNGREMEDGGTLLIEKGISLEIAEELRRRGHKVRYTTGPFGGYEAIYKDPVTGVYWGATEMRKDGTAIGY
ncbi:MAG: gamma-glutamyltransferase [Kordiimonadaceae bacterium]|jgi:gamma-glutamyltranspeptidase / glutathione hydrolase|nr:gamma-glutamyltransferase [Kordiimonadaceae bacterium]MBT6036229.1 gamma-glutamyltransferase [Kordiimonadaceae bacterium]MBT6330824.1 gamma-glutamyltransferase [Kordiimonadaceae bacterium]